MNYDHKVTGQVIGILRVKRNMTQETLASLAGISRVHLTMIELGSKSPNVATLWKIAAALDMRLSELISLVEIRLSEQYHQP